MGWRDIDVWTASGFNRLVLSSKGMFWEDVELNRVRTGEPLSAPSRRLYAKLFEGWAARGIAHSGLEVSRNVLEFIEGGMCRQFLVRSLHLKGPSHAAHIDKRSIGGDGIDELKSIEAHFPNTVNSSLPDFLVYEQHSFLGINAAHLLGKSELRSYSAVTPSALSGRSLIDIVFDNYREAISVRT